MRIPPKIKAKLEAWSKRCIGDLWEPKFVGRKEFDAEGCALAKKLQEEVGDRFHVVFSHWMAFDPNKWSSLWRDEDLLTGECEEHWMNEDLPEKIVKKVLKIYPDFCGAYLWDLDGCGMANDNPEFPDDLDKRFTAWSEFWDACYNIETMTLDAARLASEGFDEKGVALARELKNAIGEKSRVVYYCTLRKAAIEVFKDETNVEWPIETDFRQWALDHSK